MSDAPKDYTALSASQLIRMSLALSNAADQLMEEAVGAENAGNKQEAWDCLEAKEDVMARAQLHALQSIAKSLAEGIISP